MRCGFALAGMILHLMVTRAFPWIERKYLLPVVLAVVLNNVLAFGLFIPVSLIPMATADSLMKTNFLASGLVIFTLINKEKLRWDKLLSVLVCITGIFLVLQPSFIFGSENGLGNTSRVDNVTCSTCISESILHRNNYSNQTNFKNKTDFNMKSINMKDYTTQKEEPLNLIILGHIIACVSGLTYAFYVATVQYYEDFFTVENLFKCLIYDYAVGTVLSLVPMLIYENSVFPTDLRSILLLAGHVCTYVFAMPLFLYASVLISGNLTTIITTSNLIFVFIAQYTILKNIHPGHKNWIEILGVICVLFGTIFSSLVEIFKGYK